MEQQIASFITQVGFPGACVFFLGFYIKKRDEMQIEERKEERKQLIETILYSRETNEKLLETNRLLASDIKIELQDIKSELKNINTKGD